MLMEDKDAQSLEREIQGIIVPLLDEDSIPDPLKEDEQHGPCGWKEWVVNRTQIECPLCLGVIDYEKNYGISARCGHTLCQNCHSEQILKGIQRKDQFLKCPLPGCGKGHSFERLDVPNVTLVEVARKMRELREGVDCNTNRLVSQFVYCNARRNEDRMRHHTHTLEFKKYKEEYEGKMASVNSELAKANQKVIELQKLNETEKAKSKEMGIRMQKMESEWNEASSELVRYKEGSVESKAKIAVLETECAQRDKCVVEYKNKLFGMVSLKQKISILETELEVHKSLLDDSNQLLRAEATTTVPSLGACKAELETTKSELILTKAKLVEARTSLGKSEAKVRTLEQMLHTRLSKLEEAFNQQDSKRVKTNP